MSAKSLALKSLTIALCLGLLALILTWRVWGTVVLLAFLVGTILDSLKHGARLCLMMFLQYVIWGAWAPVLSAYLLNNLQFTPIQVGSVYSVFTLACVISPFIGGQAADRYLPTQTVLGILHLIGGACLLMMGQFTAFGPIVLLMLLFSLFYAPTLALTNSICFHHMPNADRDFGKIRVLGTIGWIVVNWLLTFLRGIPDDTGFKNLSRNLRTTPIFRYVFRISLWDAFGGVFTYLHAHIPVIQADCIKVGGAAAIVMGLLCFFLPSTPPKKETESPWAFLKAFALLKNKTFAIFMLISFVVVTELQFYYLLTAPFLEDIGVSRAFVPALMTLAQFAEILTMAWALPYVLPKMGVRWALAVGVIAWPIRYIIFAIGTPVWLVIASLTLHGVCYVFFFTVGQIYVNSVAPPDIRASAQSLLAIITLGIGSFVGMFFAGFVMQFFSGPSGPNYTGVFLVPVVLTVACAVAFLLWFRPEKAGAPTLS